VPSREVTWRAAALALATIVAILVGCAAPPMQTSATIPAFPWPPPAASGEADIPPNWLPPTGQPTRLSEVAQNLERALRIAKYRWWRYSSVPRGFALVTQMEQISADGTPTSARWSTELPSVRELTLFEFIRALASAPPGYYRVIVFIVTDQPWPRSGQPATGDEARRWLTEGFNRLPAEIGDMTYDAGYKTTALVYEFTKRSKSADATQIANSPTQVQEHLKKAGIYDPLSGWR
jgi:hypothetical protein